MCTKFAGAKGLASKTPGYKAILFGKKQRSQTAPRYYLKQGLAVLLIAGLSACSGGGSNNEGDPANNQAVWDQSNWNQGNWQ